MSFFLVFLAVVLVALVVWAGLGRRSRRNGGAALPAPLDGGFEEPPANLPPVLLPEHAVPEDVTRLRFSLGLRGYRMDQVDQVLDELRDQLAARDAELAELRGQLAAMEQSPQQSHGHSPEQSTEQSDDGGSAAPGRTAAEEAGTGSSGSGAPDEVAAPGKGGL